MGKWQKGEDEFTVAIQKNRKGCRLNFPLPLLQDLGEPDKVTFKRMYRDGRPKIRIIAPPVVMPGRLVVFRRKRRP